MKSLVPKKFDEDITVITPTIIIGRDAEELIKWDDEEAKWRRIYGIKQYLKVKEM